MAEAMVAGCAVLTTGSGGAQEIADLAQLPLFPKGDSQALALLLERMIQHPEFVRETALRGQEVAFQHLTLEGMIDRWERTLLSCSLQAS
jgi:glycosyltransferase involved in cell wall biosynthesis